MKISELLEAELKDRYCSDKCCGSNVKAEDCKCPPNCKGCNCNDPSVNETATGMSAGSVASVANPNAARAKVKKDKNGIPKAPQLTNPDGTAKNAQDVDANLMGGTTIKR